jgi:hypothetical protein
MTEPLPDVWAARDLPVLREIVRKLESKPVGGLADIGEIAQKLDLSWEDVRRAAMNLDRAGFVTVGGFAELPIAFVSDFSGQALERVGMWPTPETALDRMIAALQQIADNTDEDPDTRSRARKILDNLGGAGKQIGISVATAVITGGLT